VAASTILLCVLLGAPGLTAPRQETSSEASPSPGTSAPVPIYRPNPKYPSAARKAKVQGSVLLACWLETDGTFSDCRLAEKLRPDCDEAALQTVRTWRYTPARIGGVATRTLLKVTVYFSHGGVTVRDRFKP
jgi:protein TonB